MTSKQDTEYLIGSVVKALDILETVAEEAHGLGLADIASRVGFPKSSVFRYLATLENRGYVERTHDDSQYKLGTRVFELGSAVIAQTNVRELAMPYMRELRLKHGETTNLGVLSQGYVVYLEIVESMHSARMAARVGSRDYVHSTALGKAILAYLPEEEAKRVVEAVGQPRRTDKTITTWDALREELARVRTQGYAVDNGENEAEPFARCVGVPIFDRHNLPIAALSISALGERISLPQLQDMVPDLVSAGSSISAALGYSAFT